MLLASASKDLKFHTWPDGLLKHLYSPQSTELQDGQIKSISWAKEGSWLALVPPKGPTEIITIKDNLKVLHVIPDMQNPECVAFPNDTKRYISLGNSDGSVLTYNMKGKIIKKTYPKARSSIFTLEYCVTDSHLLAACKNGEVLFYNCITGTISSVFKIPNSRSISAAHCHPTRRSLACGGSEEGSLVVWDINTNKTRSHVQAHAAPVIDVVFSRQRNDFLVSLGTDRKFCFYDLSSNKIVGEFLTDRSLKALDVQPDGISLAVASSNGTIYCYDLRNMKEAKSCFVAHQNGGIKFLKFSKNFSGNVAGGKVEMNSLSDEKFEGVGQKPDNSGKEKTNFFHDSFGHMLSSPTVAAISDPSLFVSATDQKFGGDSFLAALGMSQSNNSGSTKSSVQSLRFDLTKISDVKQVEDVKSLQGVRSLQEVRRFDEIKRLNDVQKLDDIKKLEDVKKLDEVKSAPKTPIVLNKPVINLIQGTTMRSPSFNMNISSKLPTSTPRFPTNNSLGNVLSPILSSSENQFQQKNDGAELHGQGLQEIRTMMKELKDEIKSELNEFKNEVRFEIMNVRDCLIREHLRLQWAVCSEFTALEEKFDSFKNGKCEE